MHAIEVMEERVKPMTQGNPYDVLGVSKDATDVEIKAAYAAILNSIKTGKLPPDEAMARLTETRAAYKSINDSRAAVSTEPPISAPPSLAKDPAAAAWGKPAGQALASMLPTTPPSLAKSVTASPAESFAVTAEKSFEIKFGNPPRHGRKNINFKLYGKGEFRINKESVLIAGKRHRMFWFGAPEVHELRASEIINVVVSGKAVQFETNPGNGEIAQKITFNAVDQGTASQIADILPKEKTRAFAKEQAERADFKERLDNVSPLAFVTPTIVALNVLYFLVMASRGAGLMTPNAEVAVAWGTNFGPLTLSGQWWRLFTCTFIHFGLFHILFNMLALYQTGKMVERMYGSGRYLMLYVFAGLSGSVASLLWNPAVNSAGASGAIFGVFGGLLAFMLNSNNEVPVSVMNEHRNSTLFFIGYNLLNGFSHAGIDNAAHIGGLLGGLAMGFLLARPVEASARSEANLGRIGLASVAGVIGLGGVSYPLYHPSEAAQQEMAFIQAMNAVTVKEKKVITATQKLQTNYKTMSSSEITEEIDQEIIPQWESLYQSVDDAKLSEQSKRYQLRVVLLTYLDDQRKSMHLLSDAIRYNDNRLIEKEKLAIDDAKTQLQAIQKLMAH